MHVYLVEILSGANREHKDIMVCASKAVGMVEIGARMPGCDFIDHDETGTIGYDDACVTANGYTGVAHIWRMPVMGFVSL